MNLLDAAIGPIVEAPIASAVALASFAIVALALFEIAAAHRRLHLLARSRSGTPPREAPARRSVIVGWTIAALYSAALGSTALHAVLNPLPGP